MSTTTSQPDDARACAIRSRERLKLSIPDGYEQLAGVDPDEHLILLAGEHPNGNGWDEKQRGVWCKKAQCFLFDDFPGFCPNLSPAQVLRFGSFGGGYFRPITSAVTGKTYKDVWLELPSQWLKGLKADTHLSSPTYRKAVNRYGVGCGAKQGAKSDPFGQLYWEQKGWIASQDPYGWFMWYCRFFQGRRSDDDQRQVDRWTRLAGQKGRWKQFLIGKCLRAGRPFDDTSVSPVVRQTLQHWAYRLTEKHFRLGAQRVRARGAPYIPRSQLTAVMSSPTGDTRNGEEGGSSTVSRTSSRDRGKGRTRKRKRKP